MVYNSKLNYCTASPDSLFGVKFNYSCYLHDRQYRNEVKKRKTRRQADKDLYENIYKIFKENTKPLNFYFFKIKNPKAIEVISPFLGLLIGRIYFRAVSKFAAFTWKNE